MKRKLWGDLETFSEIQIKHGVHKYKEKAKILLFAYALDDGEPNVWDMTSLTPMPKDLSDALKDPECEVWFHNTGFDRTIIRKVMGPHVCPPIERWRDTMIQALAHSLPAGLAQLCEVLKVPTDMAKDKDGKRLIRLFCMPRPKNCSIRIATKETHPEDWQKFVDYATADIVAMRECHRRMPKWNLSKAEVALWHLDQHINDRGVCIDLDLARSAVRATDREQERLSDEVYRLTDGEVSAATKRDAMLRYLLSSYDIEIENLQKATVERLLEYGGLPPEVNDLLLIRQQASSTSTAKYQKIVDCTNSDGRLRGLLQFCGANRTGRWAGRGPQFHNLPRPALKQHIIDTGIDALKANCEDLVTENVMELCSSAVRGTIIAAPGKKLVVADLSNIEGRVLAWIAGEGWKIDAFKAFDEGKGHDLYVMAYASAFGLDPEDVSKDQRQVGKVMELAFGYQGAVGAWVTFATAYNIDLEEMAERAYPNIPKATIDKSTEMRAWAKSKKMADFGLSDKAWIVCDAFKALWREAHSNVVELWNDLETAMREAIVNPGQTYRAKGMPIRRDGSWLRIRLPSGRYLSYPGVQVDEKGKISYAGVNQFTRQWCRVSSYGGKIAENVVQAASRDILAHGLIGAEMANYRPVISIHDEIITEPPDSPDFNVEGLAKIMSTNPEWADGLPLAAAGFEAYRYKKD
jgi:DNA polymerase